LEREIFKKSDGLLREGDDVKFAFIAAEKAWAPVAVSCKLLGVSRSGFYAWVERGPSARKAEDEKLAVHIRAIHEASGKRYGSPRVHAELEAEGVDVSRKRVARLMAELGLESVRKRPYKATTDSKHALPVAENILDRKFEVDAPNVAWVTGDHVRLDRGGVVVPRGNP
jgi:hypothetical protein